MRSSLANGALEPLAGELDLRAARMYSNGFLSPIFTRIIASI
jgi:hypothetical protein